MSTEPRRRVLLPLLPLLLLSSPRPASADQFDTLDGKVLAGILRSKDLKTAPGITSNEIAGLPALFKESRAALLFVKTGSGNFARLLVTPELRKHADGKGDPFPVLVVERYDTFDGSNPGQRVARGRDLMLFDGFQFDLDSGQVVPPGEGGDLLFAVKGEKSPRLSTIGESRMLSPAKLPVPEAGAPPQPTPGRAVVARDFAGRYHLFSDGRLSGTLDLKVQDKGEVVGTFRSDAQGASYPLSGQIAADTPQRVQFSIQFPRSRQEFDGYLWTDGKGAVAGTTVMLEKTFGFFAVREGGRIAPEGVEVKGLDSAGK